jgi:hypothetical protein
MKSRKLNVSKHRYQDRDELELRLKKTAKVVDALIEIDGERMVRK